MINARPPDTPSAKNAKRDKLDAPVHATPVLHAVLNALGGGPERERLVQLWNNWAMVMGPELTSLALPLGARRDLLLIGAEDAMTMQELHLQIDEILQRVNAFMESRFFSGVNIALLFKKSALCGTRAQSAVPCAYPTEPSNSTGCFLSGMDMASPVTRCYAAFAGYGDGK
ncbi:DUF721 domain-containing protein [Candidatus Desulfovibrio trichonymphae]|uniref:DUF721 domain-containing protein n=1 Tax=Candidatus Desulfovibrio trichonymphae TaxID=1725232 RepID=A0A1J1E3B2_9BACT|nr:DUF721 domain-containing protein [Candidatus Desulfovibrio trichonymphae]BAV92395.1 conserved hypothetical protein [Candidatus Desulfovibrio trichonymphae]GHU90542.1 hypothetical protein AGMMS49925_03230 [Deltaproteobacteria bacterium]GHU97363.1 hypothetical protein AGMMS50248_01380 [Deltaproteobacteria bacterium]